MDEEEIVNLLGSTDNDFILAKSWLIPVPAAAVIQEGQALLFMTGRKGYVGGQRCFFF